MRVLEHTLDGRERRGRTSVAAAVDERQAGQLQAPLDLARQPRLAHARGGAHEHDHDDDHDHGHGHDGHGHPHPHR